MRITERKRLLQVKPLYRVKELAIVAGVSRWTMLRMLRKAGVQLVATEGDGARGMYVTLVSLKGAFPELWDSMVLARLIAD